MRKCSTISRQTHDAREETLLGSDVFRQILKGGLTLAVCKSGAINSTFPAAASAAVEALSYLLGQQFTLRPCNLSVLYFLPTYFQTLRVVGCCIITGTQLVGLLFFRHNRELQSL